MNDFKNIRREVNENGLCVLTFDKPDSAANIFDQATFAELNAHLDWLEGEGRGQCKGVIFATAKPKIFLAGADLIGFTKGEINAEILGKLIDQGQGTFERIANLPIPSVAAIHGVCLGGGCELALACDWRVASNDSSTKIGLPEVLLGILPAWGGSTRLPRMIGLPAALGAILTGKQYAAKQALKLGWVDDVVFREGLSQAAEKRIALGRKRLAPPVFIMNKPWLAKIVAGKARAQTLAKTHGNYPAPLKALEVAVRGLSCSHEESLQNEKNAFVELAGTDASRNLMRVFLLQERAKKLRLPADLAGSVEGKARAVKNAAVVGAGIMGAGIAQWLGARGIRVLLKDIGPEPLAKGMQTIAKIVRDATKRRVFTKTEATAALDRVVPVATDVPLRNVDLVIEAAVEKLELKKKIFAGLETASGPETVLATNTSALSIDDIAAGLQKPERVVGIHFFNPVHRMQLVEIVRGPQSSAAAVDLALGFVKAIGKLPVIVKDSPGFLVNRILLPYMTEAVRLFQEGHDPQRIDKLMLDFGMPMGPLRLADEVGLDVAQHVAKDLATRLPKPMPMNDILEGMMAKGWLGKKSGSGFYSYSANGKKSKGDDEARSPLNPEVSRFQTTQNPVNTDEAMIRDRLILIMVNEAARTLEEHVVEAPEDVDFGMIMGTGWAPFRGGPLRYADSRGLAEISSRLEQLGRQVGKHFEPCELIQDLGRRGAFFYADKTPAGAREFAPA